MCPRGAPGAPYSGEHGDLLSWRWSRAVRSVAGSSAWGEGRGLLPGAEGCGRHRRPAQLWVGSYVPGRRCAGAVPGGRPVPGGPVLGGLVRWSGSRSGPVAWSGVVWSRAVRSRLLGPAVGSRRRGPGGGAPWPGLAAVGGRGKLRGDADAGESGVDPGYPKIPGGGHAWLPLSRGSRRSLGRGGWLSPAGGRSGGRPSLPRRATPRLGLYSLPWSAGRVPVFGAGRPGLGRAAHGARRREGDEWGRRWARPPPESTASGRWSRRISRQCQDPAGMGAGSVAQGQNEVGGTGGPGNGLLGAGSGPMEAKTAGSLGRPGAEGMGKRANGACRGPACRRASLALRPERGSRKTAGWLLWTRDSRPGWRPDSMT